VPASELSSDVVINTALVVEEVMVNLETCLHRAIGEKLLLNLLVVDGLDNTTVLAIVAFVLKRLVLALEIALSNFPLSGCVRLALVSHNTITLEEVPNVLQFSSVAALVYLVTLDQAFWGKDLIDSSLAGDAHSV